MTLLGVESYFEDNSYKEMLKLHNQHAHFFRPEDLYEWIVYDRLVKEYGKCAVKMKSTYYYTIAHKDREAKPDFIITCKDEIIVVDAKWKVLDSKTKISFDDIAKLLRDKILAKATKAMLVYPKIGFTNSHLSLEVEHKVFEFEVKEINIYEKLQKCNSPLHN